MSEIQFELIDAVFAILIVVAAVRGAIRGFVTEVGSAASVILGIVAAVLFHRPGARLIGRSFGESMWNPLVAFLVVFLIVYILVKLVERMLAALFEKLNLNRLDSAMGLFVGIGEGLLVVAVVLFFLSWQPFFDTKAMLDRSMFARFLFPLFPSAEGIFQNARRVGNV